MRARGTVAEVAHPVRRRPAAGDCGDGGRKRGETRREGMIVPEQSTFRRVAVFVPFR